MRGGAVPPRVHLAQVGDLDAWFERTDYTLDDRLDDRLAINFIAIFIAFDARIDTSAASASFSIYFSIHACIFITLAAIILTLIITLGSDQVLRIGALAVGPAPMRKVKQLKIASFIAAPGTASTQRTYTCPRGPCAIYSHPEPIPAGGFRLHSPVGNVRNNTVQNCVQEKHEEERSKRELIVPHTCPCERGLCSAVREHGIDAETKGRWRQQRDPQLGAYFFGIPSVEERVTGQQRGKEQQRRKNGRKFCARKERGDGETECELRQRVQANEHQQKRGVHVPHEASTQCPRDEKRNSTVLTRVCRSPRRGEQARIKPHHLHQHPQLFFLLVDHRLHEP